MVHALPLPADSMGQASSQGTDGTMNQRMQQAQQCLQTRFGFAEFRPGQREVVEHLLEGRSAAAVFPTGGGKSLCYQLPALLLPGVTLVVSPLIALMKDQIDALEAKGIDAVRLDSSLDAEAHRAGIERLKNDQCKLLYVSPERFQNERFRTFVLQLRISLFAVDEAHCISEWGHSFRPDYLKLARFAQECRAERRFALTATATDTVLDDICAAFEIDRTCAVRTPFYRENLLLRMTPVTGSDRDRVLLAKIKERPRGATIVYVTQQRTSEQVAGFLASHGLPARAYHAGMPTLQREETQEWFLRDAEPIIVATIAFGMGIDKSNIRYVYHYNFSKSLENYSQEIGRAGRDERTSICETLLYPDDRRVLENFAYGDTPSSAAVHAMLAEIFSAGESFSVSTYDLANTHDIRDIVVRTLLTYLELDEYIEGGSPFYSQYKFVPNEPSAKILQRFEGERREFLTKLFSTAYKATTWFWIDLEKAMRVTGATRQRVVAALDYLATQNLLKLEVSLVRFAYRRKKSPQDLHELGEQYYAKLVGREQRELQRLADMMELLTSSNCTMKRLTVYFDNSLTKNCGHCAVCEAGGIAPVLPAAQDQEPDYWRKRLAEDPIWNDVENLRRKHRDVLSDPRVMTRLLCGLTSPWLTKAKLSRHALFGALSEVPFQEVLKKVARG